MLSKQKLCSSVSSAIVGFHNFDFIGIPSPFTGGLSLSLMYSKITAGTIQTIFKHVHPTHLHLFQVCYKVNKPQT